jgi:hypothetical protein
MHEMNASNGAICQTTSAFLFLIAVINHSQCDFVSFCKENYQKTPNKIINYILTPTQTKNYKVMPSFKINAQLID